MHLCFQGGVTGPRPNATLFLSQPDCDSDVFLFSLPEATHLNAPEAGTRSSEKGGGVGRWHALESDGRNPLLELQS